MIRIICDKCAKDISDGDERRNAVDCQRTSTRIHSYWHICEKCWEKMCTNETT